VLDVELANRAPDSVLMVLFQEIIRFIIANIVLVRYVLVETALELTTNTPGTSDLVGLPNVNQEMGIVQIKDDLRSKFRKIAFKDRIFIDPGIRQRIDVQWIELATLLFVI
jgi:hypothetical protein